MKNQILLVDKPEGMSSFGVVARVRRVLTGAENARRKEEAERLGVPFQKIKRIKIGHTGTLDPFATGLLILLIGKETKRASEFLKLDKEYIATLRLGATSTTGDPEGEITEIWRDFEESEFDKNQGFWEKSVESQQEKDGVLCRVAGADGEKTEQNVRKEPNKQVVEKCVEKFVGENLQKVPEFSAVKINGQRAYKLAREGKQVEMPTRKVMINEIEVLDYEWPELRIRCKVSSGTYIRALAEDIGGALGVGAYLTALRRTEVGKWRINDAEELDVLMSKIEKEA